MTCTDYNLSSIIFLLQQVQSDSKQTLDRLRSLRNACVDNSNNQNQLFDLNLLGTLSLIIPLGELEEKTSWQILVNMCASNSTTSRKVLSF